MKKLTEKEAWTVLADTIEDWGMLPIVGKYKCLGICSCLECMADDGFISSKLYFKMVRRLEKRFGNHKLFFWPAGQTAPRIKACRTLAKENP